jgi:hypothetical protein
VHEPLIHRCRERKHLSHSAEEALLEPYVSVLLREGELLLRWWMHEDQLSRGSKGGAHRKVLLHGRPSAVTSDDVSGRIEEKPTHACES